MGCERAGGARRHAVWNGRLRTMERTRSHPIWLLRISCNTTRGQAYGTVIVDLETYQIVDLLPDRSKETAKTWLCIHPEIEVISRDRANNYSDAASEAAPQALQVADRFHLFKNICEKIKDVLDRNRSYLPLVKNPAYSPTTPSQENPPEESSGVEDEVHLQAKEVHVTQEQAFNQSDEDPASSRPLTEASQRRQLNRDKRYALYEKVKDLRKQGLSHYAIADALSISMFFPPSREIKYSISPNCPTDNICLLIRVY